jgi:hypothetical protein
MRGQRHGGVVRGAEPPAELGGEEEVGQFGRPVVEPRIADGRPGDVVERNATGSVHQRAHGDHARAAGPQETVEQEAGQGEVPQVIGGHLELEPIGGLAVRSAHDPGVVEEQVEPVMPISELLGRPLHRDQVGEIDRQQLE